MKRSGISNQRAQEIYGVPILTPLFLLLWIIYQRTEKIIIKKAQTIYNYQFHVRKHLLTLLHVNLLVWKSKQAEPGNGWKIKPFHTSWDRRPQEKDRWQLSRSSRSRMGREARLPSSWGHIRAHLGQTSLQPPQIFRMPGAASLRCPEQESGIIGLFSQRHLGWRLQAAVLMCYLRLFPENEV